jgi:hypothetical protein
MEPSARQLRLQADLDAIASRSRMGWTGRAPIPQNALGMGTRRRSIPMPRTTTIHPVTAIGIDMGKTTCT